MVNKQKDTRPTAITEMRSQSTDEPFSPIRLMATGPDWVGGNVAGRKAN